MRRSVYPWHKKVVWEKYISPPSNGPGVIRNYILLYVFVNSEGTYSYWLDYLLCRGQGTYIDWGKNKFTSKEEAIKEAFAFAETRFFYELALYHTDRLMAEQLCCKTLDTALISLLLFN